MPRPEQFHPVEVFRRIQEWRATGAARREFVQWQMDYPIEAQILNLLDVESQYRAFPESQSNANVIELVKRARRELGFGDHLVPYANELPFRVEEFLAQDGVVLTEEELKLLKTVNHGSWARVGFFTKGVQRLRRLDRR